MQVVSVIYLLGQLSEVAGAIMLFLYGAPKHVLTDSVWGNTGSKEARPKKEAENKRYRQLSRFGLGLVLFGFLIQMIVFARNL